MSNSDRPFVRGTIKIEAIKKAIDHVRRQPIHESFAGYLAIRASAVKANASRNLRVDFKKFFNEYLSVPGAEKKPYLKLFIGKKEPSFANLWLNENVAGSFALSSMRPDYPLRKVARGEGTRHETRWTLVPSHAAEALVEMCYGEKVSPVSLSAVLFRDYVFEALSEEALGQEAVEHFKREFGLSADFLSLFSDEQPLGAADFDIE